MIKVSVIVPIYNVERYLAQCIDSLINQTLKDIEIILIDDGSTDNSFSICKKYEQSDSRIKAYHKNNGGVASARNQGLTIAQGEYIGFVDPDDYVDNDMFETLYLLCVENNVKISCCNAYGQGVKRTPKHSDYIQRISTDELFIKTMKECSFGLWNKLWHNTLFQNFSFPESVESGSDLSTYLLVFKTESAIYLNDYKYHYVTREGSLCKVNSIKNRMGRLETIFEMIEFLKINKPHLIPYADRLLCNTRLGFVRCLILLRNDKILDEQLQYLKKDYERTFREHSFFKRCLYKFILTNPRIYSFVYRIKN